MAHAQPHRSSSTTEEVLTDPGADRLLLGVGASIKHYELIRELGQGGMGIVYLARDTKLGRLVAIKILFERSGPTAARLLAEARLTARCRHENIVVIHDVDEIQGRPYMVLEYVKGHTLRAWMAQRDVCRARAAVPPTLAVQIMIPVVRALACAHELGIVHRDLKPENILLDDTGSIKVLDFGIAKQVSAPVVSRISGVFPAGAGGGGPPAGSGIVGTAPYMSPEQLLGSGVDARADLWAVGVVLYEMVTGVHPLAPFSLDRLAHVVDFGLPMPHAGDRPETGPLGAVIDRCLQKRRDDRIGSARALLDELEALLPTRTSLEIGEEDSPFAGLAAFQEADAARFFGRDRDVIATLARLRQQPFLVIAGPSGAGKSSFVRAGVIPTLKRTGDRWEAFILRPGRRPLSALADVLAQVGEADPADHDRIGATLRAQPGHLGARLRARCRREGSGHRILIFVDQFEELYTLGASPEERAAFVACLEGAADDASSPVRALIAIRADFLERMADERHFMTGVPRGLSFLSPMGRASLREALTRPIEEVHHRFESAEMVDHMLGVLERTESPLPLLQFTAAKLWEARDREHRILTRHSYDQMGGMAGALSVHADAVLAGLSPREQRLARTVLLRLVTPERTRAVVSLDELCELAQDVEAGSREGVEQVVQRLCDARLLLVETGGEHEGTLVELIHESLIDRWAKLRQWLAASEQDAHFLARLRAAAREWEASGRSEGLLWRDRAAVEARVWYERRSAEPGADWRAGLGEREKRYLLAVVAFTQRAQRLRRQHVAGAAAALGAIALVVSYLAIRAGHEKDLAQAEAVQARNATRMAAALELQTDPTSVLAILREVEPPEVPRGWAALARWALHRRVAQVVLGHPDAVRNVGYSPDGKRIATASVDGIVRIWNADGTGDPLVLRGHGDRVYSAEFSPDGRRIVTASWDRTVRVWNADGTGEPTLIGTHDGPVNAAAWSPDGKRILTASADRTARVWNADGTGEIVTLRGHEAELLDAAWSPDGKRIATASYDRTARVWNADGTGEPIVLRGHEDRVYSVAWSPDGKRIVTGAVDKTARVWTLDGSAPPRILRGHDSSVVSVSFSPDGKRVVTGAWDKTARVWDLDGDRLPRVLEGHEDGLSSAIFSPDGKRIVTGSWDKTARVWDADEPSDPQTLRGRDDVILSVSFSPDGKRFVTASTHKTARVWSADGKGESVVLEGHESAVNTAMWSPDGKHIVTASDDGTARVWSADGTGGPVVLRGHEGRVFDAVFSPDSKRVATASGDRTVRVWNADGTGEPLVLRGHEGRVTSVAWSPDGKRIVTAAMDKTERIWNADGTGEPTIFYDHDAEVSLVAWSPDGKRIVSASMDKTARIWSADGTGQPIILRGHEHWILWAAWSPDGKYVATASQDRTVRVWNADGTGEPLVLRIDSAVNSVAWSPDGKRLVTVSDDGVVRLWADLGQLHGITDPKLWTATTYCMPVERRMELLHVPEAMAQAERRACLHHVEVARATLGRGRQP